MMISLTASKKAYGKKIRRMVSGELLDLKQGLCSSPESAKIISTGSDQIQYYRVVRTQGIHPHIIRSRDLNMGERKLGQPQMIVEQFG
jgi:hypothetical protein